MYSFTGLPEMFKEWPQPNPSPSLGFSELYHFPPLFGHFLL